MGSMEGLKAEFNGGTQAMNGGGEMMMTRRGKASGSLALPLEVGTKVMCRWRDLKMHPVKVIERRKIPHGGASDYEFYVHYTECKCTVAVLFFLVLPFCLARFVRFLF
jgi:RNA binding activity-knot of a chromodomain